MAGFCFTCQKDWNDTGTGSQIQYFFSRFHPGEAGKQHRIHAKTEFSGILNDLKAIPLKIIQPFLRFQFNCHLTLISLRLFPEPSAPSALFRSGSVFLFSGGA